MEHIVSEIGIMIIAASFLGVVSFFSKQPLILAYIIAGIVIGPYGLSLLSHNEIIHIISDIGILLLLFLVGLEMNLRNLKNLGKVAVTLGLGQVVFTGFFGYLIATLFHYPMVEAGYIAIALTFSSTVIAIKLMSEKKELNSFHGQVVIGIALVQDVVAVIALLALSGSKTSFSIVSNQFLDLAIGAILLTASTLFLSYHGLSRLMNKISSSTELLILISIAWCFLIATLGHYIGFSKEIGAFLAGVSLASLPYSYEISAKSKHIRDFFITIFFVSLGASMMFGEIGNHIIPLIVFTLFVVIGNPIIVMVLMKLLKYDKRNSFFIGMLIANISEFSLVVATLGYKLNHISQEVFSLIMLIGIITMSISSYLITYKHILYRKAKKLFKWKDRYIPKSHSHPKLSNHIILLGCDITGEQILQQIKSFKDDYIVIDHNSEVIDRLSTEGVNCMFGDVEDDDLLSDLNLKETEVIISTLPNPADNYYIIKELDAIKDQKKRPLFIAVVESGRQGIELFDKGADYVIVKSYLGANQIHELNKKLYDLGDDHCTNCHTHKESLSHKSSDEDYAKVLENLNAIRFEEIKGKRKFTKKPA